MYVKNVVKFTKKGYRVMLKTDTPPLHLPIECACFVLCLFIYGNFKMIYKITYVLIS